MSHVFHQCSVNGVVAKNAICGHILCGDQSKCGADSDTKCSHMIKLPELHLNLKGEYFDDIDQDRKPEEYRLVTPYWKKRLENRQYSSIVIKRGYPKADDSERNKRRVWKGVTRKTITHPHFGPDPVEVFAIDVSEAI